jgi:hypothetical protein
MEYLLADGIYPLWATLVKSISSPMGNKQKYFTTTQEAARKDVESFFGCFSLGLPLFVSQVAFGTGRRLH